MMHCPLCGHTAHTFNQFRYIKFLNKRARKRLNTKLFTPQPYPKPESMK